MRLGEQAWRWRLGKDEAGEVAWLKLREYMWNPGLSFNQTVKPQTLSYITYVYKYVRTSPDDSDFSRAPPHLGSPSPFQKDTQFPRKAVPCPVAWAPFPAAWYAPSPSFAPTLSNWFLFFLKNSRRTPQRVLHTISPGLILSRYIALLPSPAYPAHLLTLCLHISSVVS